MTKRFGLIFGMGVLALVSAQASITPCANTTLQGLLNLNATGGCQVDDKIFSAFTYNPGAGDPSAALVNANLNANSGSLIYGWTFQTGTNWVSNFTLGYTVTVDTTVATGCPSCVLVKATEQINGQIPSSVAGSITEGANPTVNINLSGSGASATLTENLTAATSLTKVATFTGVDSNNKFFSYESDVVQSAVPEPMTFSLMGAGLLGLGLLRKRISRVA